MHPGDLLSALLDGELDRRERAAVEAHLDGCAACRAEYEATSTARSAVRDLPVLEPPAGLLPSPAPAVRRLQPVWGWAAAGAAALALAVGLVLGSAREPAVLDLDTFADQHTARVLVQPGVQTIRSVIGEGP